MAGNEKKEKNNQAAPNRIKGKFFKEFWGEVKKLSWPTPKELTINTLTVIAFVALFAVIIGILDAVFGWGITKLLALRA